MSLEQDLHDLVGAVRALNDNVVELRLALAGKTEVYHPQPPAADPAPTGPTKDDVIEALKDLQTKTSAETVKELLRSYGAPVVGKIDPAKYAELIETARATG